MNACDTEPKKTVTPSQKPRTAILKCFLEITLAVVLWLITHAAKASTIPVDVGATIVGAVSGRFSVAGPSLNLYSATPDWGSSFLWCQEGAVCGSAITVDAPEGFTCYPCSGGSFGSLDAGILEGGVTFSGSVFIPMSSDPYVYVTFPVTLSGDIAGYQVMFTSSEGYSVGALLFDVEFTGSGIASFSGDASGGGVEFQLANYSANVTAFVTPDAPEPGTLGLLALGSLGLAFWRRRKAVASQQ
jgi:PEP-CTERM motif